LPKGGQVVLGVEDLQVRDQLGVFVDQVHPSAEQVTAFAHPLGIRIGDREVAALEEMGDFIGVDAIVLGLAAVDRFHVQSMSEHEGDVMFGTPIAEPVPAEHALDSNDDVVAERRDRLQKGLEVTGQVAVQDDRPGRVQDADVHGSCMQVDARVESMLLSVKPHDGLLGLGGA
jgi:hypothetical protein